MPPLQFLSVTVGIFSPFSKHVSVIALFFVVFNISYGISGGIPGTAKNRPVSTSLTGRPVLYHFKFSFTAPSTEIPSVSHPSDWRRIPSALLLP